MQQAQTLYEKLWSSHVVREDADGTALIYIDRHLVHEVTSPQAFEGLKLAGRKPWRVSSIVATADHNTPTDHWDEGIKDPISRLQVETPAQEEAKAGIKATAEAHLATLQDAIARARAAGRHARLIARTQRWLGDIAVNADLDAWRREMANRTQALLKE